ncbi:MAG: TetR/AcrR family transcriptional regulator [Anaerolineae bacterium]|nr:TetR/AcrR family transcriptional regulator [Anaerolineae bacterium]
MSTAKPSARQQILDTAARLFFQNGYRAIGIDTIVAESGVAKMTLYRHFPSKDALIAAYLEAMNAQFWAWFESAVEPQSGQPRAQLVAVFRALQKLVTTPACYGCPFLMAASEFPEAGHPGRQIALANKEAVRARLRDLCEQAGAPAPAQLADQLYLLMDGAFVAVRLFGVDNPAADVGLLAEQIIDCGLRR